jgi:hypothetical protein
MLFVDLEDTFINGRAVASYDVHNLYLQDWMHAFVMDFVTLSDSSGSFQMLTAGVPASGVLPAFGALPRRGLAGREAEIESTVPPAVEFVVRFAEANVRVEMTTVVKGDRLVKVISIQIGDRLVTLIVELDATTGQITIVYETAAGQQSLTNASLDQLLNLLAKEFGLDAALLKQLRTVLFEHLTL